MLFNTYDFIFIFLPIVLLLFYGINHYGQHKAAVFFLVLASLFFYGLWNPSYLWLIIGSIVFNFSIGILFNSQPTQKYFGSQIRKKILLIIGITCNLLLLGYYKYADFFIRNINFAIGSNITFEKIILPLAISFFTFQQITYLLDAFKGKTKEYSFLNYCLFVTFFPQLVSGPIVYHKEMMPQFEDEKVKKINPENLLVGAIIFFIGLFKKVVFADGIGAYATPVFDAAEQDQVLNFFDAWGGTLAFTLQIYFDFSGYSDMAIGLARMFGIILPLNFYSPYKAHNVIEYWKRWHITLSRLIKNYIFMPIAVSLKMKSLKYKFHPFLDFIITLAIPVLIAMTLCGLWHGAAWNFVIWGALHGLYIVINHGFHAIRHSMRHDINKPSLIGKGVSCFITFMAVLIPRSFYRAESYDGAINMFQAMSGLNGYGALESYDFKFLFMLALLLFIVWFVPNTQQLLHKYKPALEVYQNEIKPSKWKIFNIDYRFQYNAVGFFHALVIATAFLVSMIYMNTYEAEVFWYFSF